MKQVSNNHLKIRFTLEKNIYVFIYVICVCVCIYLLANSSVHFSERSQLSSRSYSLGYSECAQEVTQFLQTVPAPGCSTSSQLKTSLLDHLSGCAPHQMPDSPSKSQGSRGRSGTLASNLPYYVALCHIKLRFAILLCYALPY